MQPKIVPSNQFVNAMPPPELLIIRKLFKILLINVMAFGRKQYKNNQLNRAVRIQKLAGSINCYLAGLGDRISIHSAAYRRKSYGSDIAVNGKPQAVPVTKRQKSAVLGFSAVNRADSVDNMAGRKVISFG